MSKIMKRILLIGCCGSGKTTFACKLHDILKIDLYHLDLYYHQPYWVPTPEPEWNSFINKLVKRDSWIIDGNYYNSLETRLAHADTVFYLDFPILICLFHILYRTFIHLFFCKKRFDLNKKCNEKFSWEFTKYVFLFNRNFKNKILSLLDKNKSHLQIITFKKYKEMDIFLSKLLKD
jgi:adenylate kinase family enzyme